MMRPDRFTEQAQGVLAASQEVVQRMRHSQWDVEHILLALLAQEGGLTDGILRQLDVDPAQVRQQLEGILEQSPKVTYQSPQVYATPRVM